MGRSGACTIKWDFFEVMDGLLGKDPSVQPQHALSTTPLSRAPLAARSPFSAENNRSQDSSQEQATKQASDPKGTPTSVRGRKHKQSGATASSQASDTLREIKDVMAREAESRERYREGKLALLERLTESLARNTE